MSKKVRTLEYINADTGEIVDKIHTFVEYNQVDKYVMKYKGSKDFFDRLKSVNEYKVMDEFIEMIEYNTGKIYLTAERRKEIMKKIGISKTTLSNSIKGLCDAGIIIGSRNDYTINPHVFWFGDSKGRNELIREMDKI